MESRRFRFPRCIAKLRTQADHFPLAYSALDCIWGWRKPLQCNWMPCFISIASIGSRPSASAHSTRGYRDPSAWLAARRSGQRPSPVARAPVRRVHSTPPATPAGSGYDHPTRTTDRRPRSSLSDVGDEMPSADPQSPVVSTIALSSTAGFFVTCALVTRITEATTIAVPARM